uniref:Uncharacterized protein n=1 Tax=Chromera velia CCMP2878 TaxID=1169474 RepID=A0A0G4IBJ9_9ALVE|eukprot:Cvel_2176.t1-p1 / transcript=Cvel_2176.t1 / gene=Cvel_2176 / organism=Chromera_velia_CCMP2878 / gene_product=hypothetical protein / transcript_product=hypothetical protein / location=Cvel_scaffold84:83613-85896(+) / protein_length=401 / sequence_SO=supercontig / SO=protein_coding / is_pseudo=false
MQTELNLGLNPRPPYPYLQTKFQVGSCKGKSISYTLHSKVFHQDDIRPEVSNAKREVIKSIKRPDLMGVTRPPFNRSTHPIEPRIVKPSLKQPIESKADLDHSLPLHLRPPLFFTRVRDADGHLLSPEQRDQQAETLQRTLADNRSRLSPTAKIRSLRGKPRHDPIDRRAKTDNTSDSEDDGEYRRREDEWDTTNSRDTTDKHEMTRQKSSHQSAGPLGDRRDWEQSTFWTHKERAGWKREKLKARAAAMKKRETLMPTIIATYPEKFRSLRARYESDLDRDRLEKELRAPVRLVMRKSLEKQFLNASEEKIQSEIRKVLQDLDEETREEMTIPVPKELFRPNLRRTCLNRRYREHYHCGSWGFQPVAGQPVWSCCMAEKESAQGCCYRVLDPDTWMTCGL